MSLPATYHTIGEPFIVLASVESTNNYAMGLAQAGQARHGTTFFAREQTAGKGQRGKTWTTKPGANIIQSTVLEPVPLRPDHSFLLSAAMALGTWQLFKKYAGEETRIKWPNDLYWRDRKAGGMLIENIFRDKTWLYAIVGIGINLNQTVFPEDIKNPVSLKQITGRTFDVEAMAGELCACLEEAWQLLLVSDPHDLVARYNEILYKKQETVRLRKENAVFESTIIGVNTAGQLLTRDGLERQFDFGEIEWVL